MKNLILRATTGIFFVATIICAICLSPYLFLGLFSVITALSLWEFYTILDSKQENSIMLKGFHCFAGVFLFVACFLYYYEGIDSIIFAPYLLYTLCVPIVELYTKTKNSIHAWATMLLGQSYIAGTLSLLNPLIFNNGNSDSFTYIFALAMFIFVWVNDSGAYIIGVRFGKNRLFERISPKKSWEGFWGGLVSAAITSLIIAHIHTDVAWYHWLTLSIFTVGFSVWGDLVESNIKRTLSIKDSGTLLPGHGGMLDRFDSIFFAIPITYIYVQLFIQS